MESPHQAKYCSKAMKSVDIRSKDDVKESRRLVKSLNIDTCGPFPGGVYAAVDLLSVFYPVAFEDGGYEKRPRAAVINRAN